MTPDPHVFVVIPVHDRIEYTLACLESFSQQTCPNVTVIVVDDGSTDGTKAVVQQRYPSTVVLSGDGSLWWAGATNRGVFWALGRARAEDFVLTMNNDTVVSPGYVDLLLSAAREHPHTLIGSMAVDMGEEGMALDWGLRVRWWIGGSVRDVPPVAPFLDSPIPDCRAVDVLPGRGTLIPIGAFRALGPFDQTSLPHYGADYEFSRRAYSHGFGLLINRASVVRSHADATGLNPRLQKLGLLEFLRSFTSIRSHRSLLYTWRYSRLCLPPLQAAVFFVAMSVRNLVSGVRDQVRLRRGGTEGNVRAEK